VVNSTGDEVRQQFEVCTRERCAAGPSLTYTTIDAAWFDPAEDTQLPVEMGASGWITSALSEEPLVGCSR
jgi:hypothetical protein